MARLKGTSAIVPMIPDPRYPHESVDEKKIVAFGALNEMVICSLRPIAEIFKLKRPTMCKEKSMPYLDWGYGLTPAMQERTVPILAMAWDNLIQLFYLDTEANEIIKDGFYINEQEINSIHFMGDSILVILVNQSKIKVLYTRKFHAGSYS
jgi:hypothetical protein